VTTLEFRERLARRTRRAKAPIALNMLEPLEAYFRLLAHWNAKINLPRYTRPATDETFDRLLVNRSATKQIPMPGQRVVRSQVGEARVAIPLKIARPALRLTMIESKERKSAFLREAVRGLGLSETTVETERFEVAAAKTEFDGTADIVTVRAVRADGELFETAGRMLKDEGRLLMFRPAHSPSPDPPGFQRVATYPLIDLPQSFLTVFRRVFHVEHRR
jgi:16S rRNA (guanine527-N7)-methyltransferase